jgi:hypothetical protein
MLLSRNSITRRSKHPLPDFWYRLIYSILFSGMIYTNTWSHQLAPQSRSRLSNMNINLSQTYSLNILPKLKSLPKHPIAHHASPREIIHLSTLTSQLRPPHLPAGARYNSASLGAVPSLTTHQASSGIKVSLHKPALYLSNLGIGVRSFAESGLFPVC